MRVTAIVLCFALGACTDLPTAGGAPAAGETIGSAQQAYFTRYPSRLFTVAAELCDGPGQTVVSPNRNEVRCESLPDPESAAAIILQYDGTVEDLPKLVISFLGRETTQGYLMTMDSYIRVPQRTGGTQQIRFDDPRTAESFEDLLTSAGGRPL